MEGTRWIVRPDAVCRQTSRRKRLANINEGNRHYRSFRSSPYFRTARSTFKKILH
nr:unnamed protein product [Callosobruchus analis]